MCSSAQATFAWLGAFLINAGFISLISWGAVTLWPVGFVLCGLYTVFLFGSASVSEKHPILANGDRVASVQSEEEEQQHEPPLDDTLAADGAHASQQPLHTLPNLLYALGVISLGVTGFFLPVNLLSCGTGSPGSDQRPMWTTNFTKIPVEAQAWAKNANSRKTTLSSFANVNNVTLFPGTRDISTYMQALWTVSAEGDMKPKEHAQYRPISFVTFVSSDSRDETSAVCFQQQVEPGLVCSSDGETFQYPSQESVVDSFDLFAWNDILWFKTRQYRNNEQGFKVFSLNVHSMNLTCYSELIQPSNGGGDKNRTRHCTYKQEQQRMAAGTFFVTALPVTLASIALWWKKQIPSMGMTAYVGLSLMYLTTYTVIHPISMTMPRDWYWWNTVVGGLALLMLSYVVLMKEELGCVMKWGLHTAGLAFALGMALLLLDESDAFWRWLLLNLFCFGPLVYLGAATNSIFVMFLGAFGFLMDAGRFAMFLGEHVSDNESFLVIFFTFACSGLVLGAAGMQVSKYQESIRSTTIAFLEQCQSYLLSSPARVRNITEPLEDSHEEEAQQPLVDNDGIP